MVVKPLNLEIFPLVRVGDLGFRPCIVPLLLYVQPLEKLPNVVHSCRHINLLTLAPADSSFPQAGNHGQRFSDRGLFPQVYEPTADLKNGFAVATTDERWRARKAADLQDRSALRLLPLLVGEVVLLQPFARDFLERAGAKLVPGILDIESSDGAPEHAKSTGTMERVQ